MDGVDKKKAVKMSSAFLHSSGLYALHSDLYETFCDTSQLHHVFRSRTQIKRSFVCEKQRM